VGYIDPIHGPLYMGSIYSNIIYGPKLHNSCNIFSWICSYTQVMIMMGSLWTGLIESDSGVGYVS